MHHDPSHDDDELTEQELALLQRLRQARRADPVPDGVRGRILARAVEEARGHTRPSSAVGRLHIESGLPRLGDGVRRPRFSLRTAAVAACLSLSFLAVVGLRTLERGPHASPGASAGPEALSLPAPGDIAGLPIFKAVAPVWPAGVPTPSSNLLGDAPFSLQSLAWQVRRWDNLRDGPTVSAPHDFEDETLCVPLAATQRIVGLWPTAPAEGQGAKAVEGVALRANAAYRLAFKAWSSNPEGSRLLVAMGHAGAPYSAAAGVRVPVSEKAQYFTMDFVADSADSGAGIAFLASSIAGSEGARVCFGDVTFSHR